MHWGDYYAGLSAFAGVVFAITLAARHLPNHQLVSETQDRNRVRLWDSISVTYELAAGGLLALFYIVRESWVAGLFGTLVGLVGWVLYGYYIRYFYEVHLRVKRKIRRADGSYVVVRIEPTKLSTWEIVFFFASVFPLASLAAAPVLLWMQVPARLEDWFAAACTWLVFSGTTQAVIWYIKSWEQPAIMIDRAHGAKVDISSPALGGELQAGTTGD